MEEYSITADNIYNMGGKGCLLGQCQKTRRIFTNDSNGPRDGQDGNREWITILAAICADGTALSPAIIVPPLLVPPTDGHRMSLDWLGLSKYLIRRREIKLEDSGGFLFIDGHGSHLTMQFIQRCHELRILLGIYPPHSTHKLQPLDVGLFSPLANYYSQGLGHLLQISAGHTSIRRSDFFAIFWKAYELAFDQKNILSAWKKTGIWPLDPRIVQDTLPQRPQTPPEYTNDKYMVAQVHQMSQRLQLVP